MSTAGWRPGNQVSVLYCTGSPATKTYLSSPNVGGAEAEKPWFRSSVIFPVFGCSATALQHNWIHYSLKDGPATGSERFLCHWRKGYFLLVLVLK